MDIYGNPVLSYITLINHILPEREKVELLEERLLGIFPMVMPHKAERHRKICKLYLGYMQMVKEGWVMLYSSEDEYEKGFYESLQKYLPSCSRYSLRRDFKECLNYAYSCLYYSLLQKHMYYENVKAFSKEVTKRICDEHDALLNVALEELSTMKPVTDIMKKGSC